jgi:hypothetical protein
MMPPDRTLPALYPHHGRRMSARMSVRGASLLLLVFWAFVSVIYRRK